MRLTDTLKLVTITTVAIAGVVYTRKEQAADNGIIPYVPVSNNENHAEAAAPQKTKFAFKDIVAGRKYFDHVVKNFNQAAFAIYLGDIRDYIVNGNPDVVQEAKAMTLYMGLYREYNRLHDPVNYYMADDKEAEQCRVIFLTSDDALLKRLYMKGFDAFVKSKSLPEVDAYLHRIYNYRADNPQDAAKTDKPLDVVREIREAKIAEFKKSASNQWDHLMRLEAQNGHPRKFTTPMAEQIAKRDFMQLTKEQRSAMIDAERNNYPAPRAESVEEGERSRRATESRRTGTRNR